MAFGSMSRELSTAVATPKTSWRTVRSRGRIFPGKQGSSRACETHEFLNANSFFLQMAKRTDISFERNFNGTSVIFFVWGQSRAG